MTCPRCGGPTEEVRVSESVHHMKCEEDECEPPNMLIPEVTVRGALKALRDKIGAWASG